MKMLKLYNIRLTNHNLGLGQDFFRYNTEIMVYKIKKSQIRLHQVENICASKETIEKWNV